MRIVVSGLVVLSLAAWAAAQPGPGDPPKRPLLDRAFRALDADRDGAITREEAERGLPEIAGRIRERVGRPPGPAEPPGSPMMPRIERLIEEKVGEAIERLRRQRWHPDEFGPPGRRPEPGPVWGARGLRGPQFGTRQWPMGARAWGRAWCEPGRPGPWGGPGFDAAPRRFSERLFRRGGGWGPSRGPGGPPFERPVGPQAGPGVEKGLFRALDANGDGVIDQAEIDRAPEVLSRLKGDEKGIRPEQLRRAGPGVREAAPDVERPREPRERDRERDRRGNPDRPRGPKEHRDRDDDRE